MGRSFFNYVRKEPVRKQAQIIQFAPFFMAAQQSTLTRVFEQYAEDSITDEQVQRVLEPVLRKIQAREI